MRILLSSPSHPKDFPFSFKSFLRYHVLIYLMSMPLSPTPPHVLRRKESLLDYWTHISLESIHMLYSYGSLCSSLRCVRPLWTLFLLSTSSLSPTRHSVSVLIMTMTLTYVGCIRHCLICLKSVSNLNLHRMR